MDQGIAGLLGAALGGLVGVVGTLWATRLAGKDQGRNQQEHWRRQQRRDAYGRLVSEAAEALRLGSRAQDAFEDRDPSGAGFCEQFSEVVHRLDAAEMLVAFEGPEEAAEAAGELITEFYVWANCLEDAIAIAERRVTPPAEGPPSMSELWDHRDRSSEALSSFTRFCRPLLGPDPLPPRRQRSRPSPQLPS
ncbi:hypothetical protein [Streptomyces justiciae]|uniref:Secreted protein n=1 Tax=Streptomyces justiciae TaxID=2780140 RepID=A0ABU3M482_9ACTN|nr:hypothetical protein [Streptomyces justiciae]MDT7846302.1 hypothetical protein [Streptomyces justiciae]